MLYKTLVLDEERISRQPLISARRDTADNGPGRWGWQYRTSSEPAWKIPTPDDGPRKNCPPRREKERKTLVLAQRGEQDERCSHGQDQAVGERAPTRKERARALRIQAELNGKKQRLA